MLSLKHSLVQGKKKLKDEDYSPPTTKKKSLKRTQPTRLPCPPLPEAPSPIAIYMDKLTEQKNLMSSPHDVDGCSFIREVCYDGIVRWVVPLDVNCSICKDIKSRAVAISFLFKLSRHFIPYLSYVLVMSVRYRRWNSFICRSL